MRKLLALGKKYDVSIRMVKPIKMQEFFQKLAKLNQPIEEIQKSTTNQAIQNTQPARVLIAEDNLVNKLLAKTVVSRILTNATIIEVDNGQEALEQFKQDQPDIILMDIQMPIMNGYQATEEIRNSKTIKLIYRLLL
jgi:PleD family two-component response regulator